MGPRIVMVTPVPTSSRQGNARTAERWAGHLRGLGCRVRIIQNWESQPADAMVALHAWRSAASIRRFRRRHPTSPLVVTLTGTDLYRDLKNRAAARRSLELADRLVVLQPDGLSYLPAGVRGKATVILQSAEPPAGRIERREDCFEISVIGHLRAVKDPFRAALAARELPASSRIRIVHYGAALTDACARRATLETERNARYRWLGEVSHPRARRALAASQAMVVSSKLEGGANVICEAAVCHVPVLAASISGNRGMLGDDYPAYFEVGDTRGLRALMLRVEREADFRDQLVLAMRRLAGRFRPERERAELQRLLRSLRLLD